MVMKNSISLQSIRSLQNIALDLTNLWLRWFIQGDQSRYLSKYIPRYFTSLDAWGFLHKSLNQIKVKLLFLSSENNDYSFSNIKRNFVYM